MPTSKRTTINIRLKRVYEPATTDDGARVLIDRLWPRGLRKADVKLDLWLKDIAPTSDLRKSVNGGVKTGHGSEQKSATVSPA